MTLPSWQSLALELVEAGSDADSRAVMCRRVFESVRRHLGFENGSVLAFDSDRVFVWNKPRAYGLLWQQGRQRYARELMPMLAAATRGAHVASDDQAFSVGERTRLSFYADYVWPLRVKSYAAVLLGPGGVQSQAMSFSRDSASGFRAEELELLRRLRPTLSLLMRLFPMDEPAAPRRVNARGTELPLTRREAEIAGYVARGLRNAEIALLCGSSPHTIRNQLAVIFKKLGVSTRAELAMCVHTHREP